MDHNRKVDNHLLLGGYAGVIINQSCLLIDRDRPNLLPMK